MTFQKIPLEQWKKLTLQEQDYYTLEFNKSVEKRKRITIIATRTIALFCVFVLFFIGYSQLMAVQSYEGIISEYGPYTHCYLCGLQNFKKCECYYQKIYDYGNFKVEYNETQIALDLAESNAEICIPYRVSQENKLNEMLKNFNINSS